MSTFHEKPSRVDIKFLSVWKNLYKFFIHISKPCMTLLKHFEKKKIKMKAVVIRWTNFIVR